MVFRNQWLIAPKRQRHLEQLVQHSGVIRYYIRRKPFHGILETEYGNTFTYKVKGAVQNNKTKNWIKTAIRHLDASLDVDFKEVRKSSDAHLRFLAAKHVSKPWSRDTTGESIWNPRGGGDSAGLATVLVKKQKNLSDQMATITHELGHALGLKHPKEKPYSPEFSTANTIMSYNNARDPQFVYKEFTINDLRALSSLWGLEGGKSSSLETRVPFPSQVNCESPRIEDDSSFATMVPAKFSTKGDDYLVADVPNSNLYGAAGDDTIVGSKGRDTLGGGLGNDVLDGGPGGDVLYGHEGKDHFVVSEGEGKDVINFFEQGLDVIHIKHAGGKLALTEHKDGLSVSLDGSQLVLMKDIEFDFGPCSEALAVIDNKFIA